MLTENWDLNSSPTWGSNIKKAFRRPAFDSFYQCYLEGREKTLAEFREEVNNFKSEPKILKKVLNEVFLVFDKRLYVISNTEKQKKELLC